MTPETRGVIWEDVLFNKKFSHPHPPENWWTENKSDFFFNHQRPTSPCLSIFHMTCRNITSIVQFYFTIPSGVCSNSSSSVHVLFFFWYLTFSFQTPVIAVVGNDACWSQISREQVPILGSNVACGLAFTGDFCMWCWVLAVTVYSLLTPVYPIFPDCRLSHGGWWVRWKGLPHEAWGWGQAQRHHQTGSEGEPGGQSCSS